MVDNLVFGGKRRGLIYHGHSKSRLLVFDLTDRHVRNDNPTDRKLVKLDACAVTVVEINPSKPVKPVAWRHLAGRRHFDGEQN